MKRKSLFEIVLMAKSDNADMSVDKSPDVSVEGCTKYTWSLSLTRKKMEQFPVIGNYNIDQTVLTKMFKTEKGSGF